jgi:hypothetical protein
MSGPGPQIGLLGIQSLLAIELPMMLLQMAVSWWPALGVEQVWLL